MPGSRCALLGGIVIGGVRDNSSVFYNPGALAHSDSSSISIAANSFQYEIYKIQNGGGVNIDFNSKSFQTIPLVTLSGLYKPKSSSKSTYGFMVFTKNQTSNSFSRRVDDSLPWKNVLYGFDTSYYISKNPNVGYIGDFNMSTRLSEVWAGLCYSYKFNKYIAVGISPFIAYRMQSFNKSFVSRVMFDEKSNYGQSKVLSMGFNDVANIHSTNVRGLIKLGLDFDFDKLKLGLVYSFKSYNLGGRALISRDINYSGGIADPYTSIQTFFGAPLDTAASPYQYSLNDRQENLKVVYKSPQSLAFGIQYTFKNTIFRFSTEYYEGVKTYTSIKPEAENFYRSGEITPILFSNQTVKSALSDEYLKVTEASKAVLNFGIAIEQNLGNQIVKLLNSISSKSNVVNGVSISGSYRTDKTHYQKSSDDFWIYNYGYNKNRDTSLTVGQRLSFSEVNLHHFTLGITINRRKSDFHIGFSYTTGANVNFQALNNMAQPKDNVITSNLGAIPNFKQPAKFNYNSYSFIFGYTYHIK